MLISHVAVLRHVPERHAAVGEVQQAPLIPVRSRRAYRVVAIRADGRVVQRARSEPEVERRVHFLGVEHVDDLRAEVGGRREPSPRELALDARVPRVLRGRLQIRRQR